ncbi:MAG: 30S ribosomal protein S27ae [Candidatus Micrarchaeaceae archaeon]
MAQQSKAGNEKEGSARAYKQAKKFCPKCGSRMAEHADRFACGKCGYTEWSKPEKQQQQQAQEQKQQQSAQAKPSGAAAGQ